MANQFKKALAYALVAASTFSLAAPQAQLFVPSSIVMAAADTKITIDSSLNATESIALDTVITVKMPTATTETSNGLVGNITYKVSTSSDCLKLKLDGTDVAGKETTYDPSVNNKLDFVGVKGGESTLTITKYVGSDVVGYQSSLISVVSKSSLALTVTGPIDKGSVTAGQTVKVYKGEAFKIDAKTSTAPAQISGITDFQTQVGSVGIVSLVTEDKAGVGSIEAVDVKRPSLKEDTYSVYFTANAAGTTTITINQAAAKDKSTSANSISFKVEVIPRDGELSVAYDHDRDGNLTTYTADKYDDVRFTTKKAPDSVALDLAKHKEIRLSASSGSNQAINYTSSDTNVATVDGKGLVTAVAEGSADIKIATATSPTSGVKASEITVRINVTKEEVAYITVTGDINVSSVGKYDGTRVPDITVGKELSSAADAYENIVKGEKTLILSTKDKSSANISITSNANDYLNITPSDTGIITYTAGKLTAVRPGSAYLTIETKPGAKVASSSKVIIYVYVTDLYANNTIRTGSAISVNPVKNTAAVGASSTYGEVKYDTKLYTYDEKTEKYTEESKSGVTIDARGNVSYKAAGTSGTVYAKAYVENSKEALGTKNVYIPINYSDKAENVISISGISNDAVSLVAGSTATANVSATDAKTEFTVTSSNEAVATASIVNGVITITGRSAGTALISVKGVSKTDGYSNPETKSIAVTVTTVALKSATITPVTKTVSATKFKKAAKKVLTVKVKGSTGKISVANKSASNIKKYVRTVVKGRTVAITLKKGAKAGTYKVKVTVDANGAYKKTAKTVTITVK